MRQLKRRQGEAGYTIIIVLMLVGISGVILGASLKYGASDARTIHATKVRSERYYTSEATLGRVVSWLRLYSQQMVTPFRKQEFYTRFDRVAPSMGSNDTGTDPVPSKLRLNGTNETAIIVTDASLGTAAFPDSQDITTNDPFDVPVEFASADLGFGKVKLTLIDAIADTPAKDYGDTDLGNPLPETDFFPVYRIDAYSNTEENAHVYGTVVGDVVHVFDLGIYGQDYLEINQACDSFLSSNGPYSVGSRRANCPAGSNSTSAIHKNEEIYGTLQTNGSIDPDPPYGGDTCADFQVGCPNKGETCAGEDCGVPLLEIFDPWATYCPTDQGDYTVPAGTTETLTVASDAPADKCWNRVVVPANTTLVLETTNNPYFIAILELQNNSNSVIDVQPSPANGSVELWVGEVVGDMFNGNQIVNTGNPTSFYMYYLGTNPLTLNGNADMNTAFVAPYAPVSVSGNFDYHGALLARELTLSGSGSIHYDESLGGTGDISNIQYKVEELVQHFR